MILSKWYTRKELTTRNAILFCGNLISNAFSALVGAGVLSNMEGTLGHAAWRWLFWIEGKFSAKASAPSPFFSSTNFPIKSGQCWLTRSFLGAVTMLVAITAAFVLPDLPHNTRGFTAEELDVAQLRMIEDVGEKDEDAESQGAFGGLFMALKDYKMYLMSLTFTAYVVGLSFNAFFVRARPPLPETTLVQKRADHLQSLLLPRRWVIATCRLCL